MSFVSESSQQTLARVDGWGINIADQAAAVSQIIRAAQHGDAFSVVTLNLDHVVQLRHNAEFRHAYRLASYVTADGAPIAMLASRQGVQVERTTGADLVVPLCEAAAHEKLSIFLFGSSNGVLASAGQVLSHCTGYELDIVGTEAPRQGFDPTGPEADAAIERIAASGANICFVALGAPKQEIFAARAVEKGVRVGFVCIGAALDFLAGQQPRAPELLQKNGFEWLWRLSTNPRRLTGRYARCALVLGDLVIATATSEWRKAARREVRRPS